MNASQPKYCTERNMCDEYVCLFVLLVTSLATLARNSSVTVYRCLQVVEVVQHIAGCLSGSLAAEKQSLANMGLACRMLYDPAMNALWETLEDFLSLHYCLPDDIVQYEEDEEET